MIPRSFQKLKKFILRERTGKIVALDAINGQLPDKIKFVFCLNSLDDNGKPLVSKHFNHRLHDILCFFIGKVGLRKRPVKFDHGDRQFDKVVEVGSLRTEIIERKRHAQR